MNAIQFIKEHGVEKAREVVDGAPDKTATHYVFRKIPNYYSVDFQSWHNDGEWWDSDCQTEQDLIDSYGHDFVVNLSDLKRIVESLDLLKSNGGYEEAKDTFDFAIKHGMNDLTEFGSRLKQAIADYEAIGGEHV